MRRIVKAASMVALAGLLAGNAWADPYWHRPRTSVELGFYWGAPVWYPPYYPYPIYAAPPIVVVPPSSPPPVYIEQPRPSQPLEPGYWYYCREAKAYYPYVKECSGPWEKVAPQPRQ